jgi:starch synthase
VIFISQLTMLHFAYVRWRRTPALVFNGVDTDTFSPAARASEVENARRTLGLPVDVSIALFVGRFVEKKGLHVLEIMARMRSDVLFVFAGHGALDPRRWGMPNVRVYSGLFGSTLASLYRASDLLLLPSSGEGFPLVVQEALACGLAIICGTDTAGADSRAEAFLKGVAVDLAKPERSARLFSEEMTRVLARPATDADCRARFEFAKASYSWAASAANYAAILRGLLTGTR